MKPIPKMVCIIMITDNNDRKKNIRMVLVNFFGTLAPDCIAQCFGVELVAVALVVLLNLFGFYRYKVALTKAALPSTLGGLKPHIL